MILMGYTKIPLTCQNELTGSKGLRAKARDLIFEFQLRKHHPTTVLGVPNVVVVEPVHAGAQVAAGVEAGAPNEDLVANFKGEERGVPFSAQPLPVLLHERDDLGLGKTELVEVS